MKQRQYNNYSKAEENNASLFRRFYIYQKERFPVLGHGLLVASFSFSAIAYSRICRGAENFVNGYTYLIGIFTTISLFMLIRITDEFKDAADDAQYRPQLPLPRGLISFSELLMAGICIVIVQVLINLYFFPKMLVIYFIVILYLFLMTREFFIASWLRKHQFWYVVSHMFIIPLIDIYASGLDWFLAGVDAPRGLLFFFGVSYMNGIVIEMGRKVKAPEKESPGVLTYSSMLGANNAAVLWIATLFTTLCLSIAASHFAGYGIPALIILGSVFVICASPAFLFLNKKTERLSKIIEKASACWTIAMYLTLGAVPMLKALFS